MPTLAVTGLHTMSRKKHRRRKKSTKRPTESSQQVELPPSNPAQENRFGKWPESVSSASLAIALAVPLGLALTPAFAAEFKAAKAILLGCAAGVLIAYLLWLGGRPRKALGARLGLGFVAGVTILITLFAIRWVDSRENYFLLLQNPAALTPDSKAAPPRLCQGGLNLIAGGNAYGGWKFPFAGIEVNHSPILLLETDHTGGVLVTFDVRNREGKMLARVKKNVITEYPLHAYTSRKDLHSLTVEDEDGNLALDIDYVNQHVIAIKGQLYLGPNTLLKMYDNAVMVDPLTNLQIGTVYSNDSFCNAIEAGLQYEGIDAPWAPLPPPYWPR